MSIYDSERSCRTSKRTTSSIPGGKHPDPQCAEPPADGAPYGPNVRKCLDHALAVSKGLGFRTTDLDHQMGWCEFGEGDEMIAVLGHLDVVPEGEGWTFDPFR